MNEEGIINQISSVSEILEGDVTTTLLEALAEGVIIIDQEGFIVLVNDRITQLTGYEKQEIIGQSLNIVIPNNYVSRHKDHLKSYFKEPKIRPMGVGFDLSAKRKDGSTFPIEISLSHLKTESGNLGIALITDISSRKKAENDLKKRNKELDDYAHTVAHNINSLLNSIIGFSNLLIHTWGDNPKEKEILYLNKIADSGKKLNNVVKEILVFSSMKKSDVEKQMVNMRKIIDNACDRFKYQIAEKSAKINISETIHDCKSHEPWIEEVWYNYISNALKYGGTPPQIIITSEKLENGYIKYSVYDNGIGVPEELKDVIFEENNLEKDKRTKGFGLGLSIVKNIIEKLNGYVSVESEPKQNGSTFSFYLKNK